MLSFRGVVFLLFLFENWMTLARWFNSWPFYPLVKKSPISVERVTWTGHPKKVTNSQNPRGNGCHRESCFGQGGKFGSDWWVQKNNDNSNKPHKVHHLFHKINRRNHVFDWFEWIETEGVGVYEDVVFGCGRLKIVGPQEKPATSLILKFRNLVGQSMGRVSRM